MNRIRAFIVKLFTPQRSSTVRYMFSLSALAVVSAFLAAQVIESEPVSYIRLDVSASAVEAGDIFQVDVYANAGEPVNAVDVTLRFDKERVEVKQVDRGQSVLTIWTEDPVIEENQVILRGGTFRRGFIGEHKLVTIDLLAKETGQSSFSVGDVVLLAGDGEGSQVTVAENSESSASLFIYDENTDPSTIEVDVEVKIATDINGDGRVTLSDVSAFLAAWSSGGTVYDFSGDNRMTFRDFSIILADVFFGN